MNLKSNTNANGTKATAEWIGKLCKALGVPMDTFDMVKPLISPK